MQFYNAKNSDARPIPEELVLGLILQRQYVSFVELIEYLEERHYEARGDWQISLGNREHLVLWRGLSEQLFRMLQRLLSARRVFFHPAAVESYVIDGACLPLPIATQLHVSAPHWVPVTLCSFPLRKGAAA